MANPTAQVPSRQLPYGADDKFYIGYPNGQSDTFVNGEMIGTDPSSGFGAHFDDTKPLNFLGLFSEPTRIITTDLPTPILLLCKRPRMFTMPLATGTIGRGYSLGAPVFAVDSGHVQIGASGLTYGNQVGYFFDIAGSTPETVSGASSIWITPEPYGSQAQSSGGILTAPATGGKTYGVEALNKVILVPASATETLTLPPVANTVAGDSITFITTAGASVVTLKGNAAETINGANTFAMTGAQYAAATVLSIGTAWLVTSKI